MRRVGVQPEAALGQLSRTTTITSAADGARTALSHIWAQIRIQPTTVFVVLSLVFGLSVIFVMPPLRGPDEIAHFLRIYSYTRGELLPAAEVDGQKGIFVESHLHNELHFFKGAGEWFASARDEGVRYGQIMAVHRNFVTATNDELDQAPVFMPFAGTEGYHPVAYIPYIIAGAIGRALGLEFPDLLLLMRLFGLVAFTAAVAYAIAITPVLKWAFVLIALLPVAIYNRSVLSADGAALCSALVITALCLSAVYKSVAAPVWQRSLWMTLGALSKQPQIVFVLLELMVYPLKELRRCWSRVAIVVLPSLILSPMWVVAVSAEIAAWRLQLEEFSSARAFRSNLEAPLYVGASRSFPTGGMESPQRLGRRAVAGTHRHPGLAGYCASNLDLSCAHDPPLARAFAEIEARRSHPCAGDGYYRPYRAGLCWGCLSDLFSYLYAS